MEREAGSYIVDEKGNLIPNENDEAMKKRAEGTTPLIPLNKGGIKEGDSDADTKKKKREVKEDGGYNKVSE